MTTAQQANEIARPTAAIEHHWIVTVQFDNGRQAATYDGPVDVTPGSNTRSSVYADLRKLFFSLTPNQF